MDNADPAPSSQLDRRARGRAHAFRFFATPRDAPRSRRPTDAVLLGLGLATLVAASWAAEPAGRLSNDLTRLVEDTPGWAQSAWQVFFDFMPFWAVVLVVRSVARRFFTLAASQVAGGAVEYHGGLPEPPGRRGRPGRARGLRPRPHSERRPDRDPRHPVGLRHGGVGRRIARTVAAVPVLRPHRARARLPGNPRDPGIDLRRGGRRTRSGCSGRCGSPPRIRLCPSPAGWA